MGLQYNIGWSDEEIKEDQEKRINIFLEFHTLNLSGNADVKKYEGDIGLKGVWFEIFNDEISVLWSPDRNYGIRNCREINNYRDLYLKFGLKLDDY